MMLPENEYFSVVTLASRQDLLDKSVALLNQEWPRSVGARMHSQQKSCREYPPMSFLLLDDGGQLVGHARVCLLPKRSTSFWIESVLIDKQFRGRGLGKYLMLELEKWMLNNGFNEAYLSTEDQMLFYRHCGYSNCAPILHSTATTSVFAALETLNVPETTTATQQLKKKENVELDAGDVPPPPPPPPSIATKPNTTSIATIHHQYMRKGLK